MDVDQHQNHNGGDGDGDGDGDGAMMIFILSLSGELSPLVVVDLGDILQSRCGDRDHDEVDGGFDNPYEKREGWYT